MKEVVLGLGSNLKYNGMSSLELLCNACRELKNILSNISYSSVYKTKAMYVTNQDDFYNMVVFGFVNDDIDPYKLLELINNIEAKFGRDRSKEIRFGPRPLDIDIEYFENNYLNTEKLTIPHPRIKERSFVLIPALEILTKSADNKKKVVLENWLNQLPDSEKKLEIVISSEDLLKL